MKTIYTPEMQLPDSITFDERIRAAAQVITSEMEKLSAEIKKVLHLPRLDELSGVILDSLAEQLHVDFYDALNLTQEEKRELIRSSIAVHRTKGTIGAVEKVANEFFDSAKVIETGSFRFKIEAAAYKSSPDAFCQVMKRLYDAKNVRSWLESIDIMLDEEIPLTQGGGIVEGGIIEFPLDKPPDITLDLTAGCCHFNTGEITVPLDKPPDITFDLTAGCALFIGGDISLDAQAVDAPRFIENPYADLLIANIGIARGDYDLLAVQDMEPNIVKIFFDFPIKPQHRRHRAISMTEPRENLTKEEILAVGQYAVDNKIITNARGEIADKVRMAALKYRSEEIIF